MWAFFAGKDIFHERLHVSATYVKFDVKDGMVDFLVSFPSGPR